MQKDHGRMKHGSAGRAPYLSGQGKTVLGGEGHALGRRRRAVRRQDEPGALGVD